MTGCGGVLTFGLRQAERVTDFLESLRLCTIAVSLGGTKTFIESPRLMSHVQGGPENASLRVIPANAIRLSVGLEDADDIVADLASGLSKVSRARPGQGTARRSPALPAAPPHRRWRAQLVPATRLRRSISTTSRQRP